MLIIIGLVKKKNRGVFRLVDSCILLFSTPGSRNGLEGDLVEIFVGFKIHLLAIHLDRCILYSLRICH